MKRGSILRIKIFKLTKNNVKINNPTKELENKILNKIPINQIFIYSERNNKVKLYLENSTLYLETNSDSPSTKSKGVRFSSAELITNQTIKNPNFKKEESSIL